MKTIQVTILIAFALQISGKSIYCYAANNALNSSFVQSDEKNTFEFIESNNIKSLRLYKKGWELSSPIIELNGKEKILLSFDDIGENTDTYSYSLTHCNSNWEDSKLYFSDFQTGFEVNEIKDYSYSTSTVFNYMHCMLEIPNEDISIKISGNYVIRVFSRYNPEKILLQKRFSVYEPLADVKTIVRKPSAGDKMISGQKVEVKVNYGNIPISNPLGETKLVVCQNYPFQNCQSATKPSIIRQNEFEYSNPDLFIFESGNEFRLFDIRNLRFPAQGVKNVDFYAGMFQVQLQPAEGKSNLKYSYYSDMNGRYVMAKENSQHSHLEADYAWVYFSLTSKIPVDKGWNVYLYGELTNWQLSANNIMTYSNESKSYEITKLLKQGAYSFSYILANEQTGEVDISYFEGSHFDTENSYTTFFYYKPLGARYERLIGVGGTSSIQ